MDGRRSRALDLLAERATQGLPPEREVELDVLLAELPGLDRESFEIAASAIELAYVEADPPPLPAALLRRVIRQATGQP